MHHSVYTLAICAIAELFRKMLLRNGKIDMIFLQRHLAAVFIGVYAVDMMELHFLIFAFFASMIFPCNTG